MKSIKIVACVLILVFALTVLTGCINANIEVDIRKDGAASMSAQIKITEELYNKIVALESTEMDNESNPAHKSPLLESKNFKKQAEGNTYVYTIEKTEYDTYSELADTLRNLEVFSEVPLFNALTIANNNNSDYSFYLKTTEIDSDKIKNVTGLDSIPSDWMQLSMTVSLPGKIDIDSLKYDEKTKINVIDENTLLFTITDFTDPHVVSITSFSSSIPYAPFIFIGATICCMLVVLVFRGNRSENKEKPENDDREIYL